MDEKQSAIKAKKVTLTLVSGLTSPITQKKTNQHLQFIPSFDGVTRVITSR